MNPLVSVILPVYNAEKYIKVCLTSILNQKYQNLEIIIINDGSTDSSLDIIDSFYDNRIRIYNNDKNQGLVYSLNRGLELASGEYIARMDADDIMLPDRILSQLNFLTQHEDIDICGCSCELFKDNVTYGYQYFWLTPDSIKAELLFNTPIAHPTFCVRKKALNGYKYNSTYKFCEDYELLSRFLIDGNKGANLPRALLRYRQTSQSQTSLGEKNEAERYRLISQTQNYVLQNGIHLFNDGYYQRLHYILSLSERIKNLDFAEFPVGIIKKYLSSLRYHNKTSNYCNANDLNMVLGKIWLKIIIFHRKSTFRNKFKLLFSRYSFYGVRYLIYRKIHY